MTTQVNPPVVVGVDGSESARAAVRWAAAEAASHGAPLHLVYVIGAPLDYGPGLGVVPIDYETFRKAGDEAIADAAKSAEEAAAVKVSAFVVGGNPTTVLLERSREARLIVVGTRGLGAVKRGVLGSVSTAVSRRAHCPVAVIPDQAEHTAGAVVVGVDGTEADSPAVAIAFDEASHRDAELVVLHVWTMDGILSTATLRTEAYALLSESMAGYRERYPEVRMRRTVVENSPVKRLVEASDTAQLVVVGTHNPGLVAELIFGSTSQAVAHRTHCPVIIAKAPEAA
ncbi:MAG: universal stress protein [Mycobacteriaceae bacterium]|nr:universal stress protein [Mycobacteriaceae bacterium]